jgi:hypothetical protein
MYQSYNITIDLFYIQGCLSRCELAWLEVTSPNTLRLAGTNKEYPRLTRVFCKSRLHKGRGRICKVLLITSSFLHLRILLPLLGFTGCGIPLRTHPARLSALAAARCHLLRHPKWCCGERRVVTWGRATMSAIPRMLWR